MLIDSNSTALLIKIQSNINTPGNLIGTKLKCRRVDGWHGAKIFEANNNFVSFEFNDGSEVPGMPWRMFLADVKDGNIGLG
jgi:hypothetical protein